MSAKVPAIETTMEIIEVVELSDGDKAGGIAINIRATRNGKEHRLPYHIAPHLIDEIDLDALKQRVANDLDALEAKESKTQTALDRLNAQIGKTIKL